MNESGTGKIILNRLHSDAIAKNVEDYLTARLKNTPKEKIRLLTARAKKSPVILSNNVSNKIAIDIISNLEKLGATAIYKPLESFVKKPGKHKEVSENLTKSETDYTKEKEIVDSDGAETKGVKKRFSNKTIRQAVLLILLLGIAGYAYFFTSNNLFTSLLGKKPTATARIGAQQEYLPYISSVNQKTPYYLLKDTNPLEQFELVHSFSFDRRIADGLVEAFKEYTRLFSLKPNLQLNVNYSSNQIKAGLYKLIYDVSIDGSKSQSYELEISTEPERIFDNIQSLNKVLKKFSNDFSDALMPLSSVKTVKSTGKEEITRLIYTFDYMDIFDALRKIESGLNVINFNAELLLQASDIFSWLTFFKSANEDKYLADLFAVHSVSNYLIATLFKPLNEADLINSQGLLMQGLGYPAEAERRFSQNPLLRTRNIELVIAYIRKKPNEILSLLKMPATNKKLGGYLLARAYDDTLEFNALKNTLYQLLYNNPDFLLAKEFASTNMGVEARSFMEIYLQELIEKHFYLLKEFMNTDWLKVAEPLAAEIATEVRQDRAVEKWFSIHKKILDRTVSTRGSGKIITGSFMNDFLRGDLLNAFHIYYKLEADRLGRLANAGQIIDIIEKDYPESDLFHALKIKLFREYEKLSTVKILVRNANAENAGTFLIESVMDQHKWVAGQDSKWVPGSVELLELYRNIESPNANGSYSLYSYHNYFKIKPVARQYLLRAEKIDPYDYTIYREISKFDDAGKFIDRGMAFLGHSYGFVMTVADWYKKHDRPDEAIKQYEKAMELSPGQYRAYIKLGEIYEEQEKYDDAIKAWEPYLEYDEDSLSAVFIINKIAKVLFKKGEVEKAYDILLKIKDSYQNGALINFSKASEKTGKPLQAEEYFKKAAKRYPSSGSPVELALFYIRKNDLDSAVKVLKEYERYNHSSYYYSDLIDFYAEAGKPMEPASIVHKVNEGKPTVWKMWYLSKQYAEKEDYKSAASVLEPLLHQSIQPYTFAYQYFDNEVKVGEKKEDELLDELIPLLDDHPGKLSMFGIGLVGLGYYDTAFKVFLHIDKTSNYRKDVGLLFMALSWRAGSQNLQDKNVISGKIDKYPLGGMHKTLIRYLIGEFGEKEVFDAITDPNSACEAHYFMGLVNSVEGDKEKAIKHLLVSLETKAIGNIEYKYAYDLVNKLQN